MYVMHSVCMYAYYICKEIDGIYLITTTINVLHTIYAKKRMDSMLISQIISMYMIYAFCIFLQK